MAIVRDPDLYEIERREEWEQREYEAEQAQAERDHDLRIAKLKYAVQPRRKAVERGVIALLKMPVCMILAIMLPVLILCGKEVPQVLSEFLSL